MTLSDNEGFSELYQDTKDNHRDEMEDLIRKYQGEGIKTKKAEKEAGEMLEQKYRKTFFKYYKITLKLSLQLEESIAHEIICSEIKKLIQDGYPMDKAIKRILAKYAYLFEELFDNSESEESESEESVTEASASDESDSEK